MERKKRGAPPRDPLEPLKRVDKKRRDTYAEHKRNHSFSSPKTSPQHFKDAIYAARLRTITSSQPHSVVLKWVQEDQNNDWFEVVLEEGHEGLDHGRYSFMYEPVSLKEARLWVDGLKVNGGVDGA